MKLLVFFTASLLAGLVFAAPASNHLDKLVVTEEFFPEPLVIYTSKYDIVNILAPLNALNFGEDSEDADGGSFGTTIFFTLADDEGEYRVDKGLYVRRNGEVTKLLDKGREAAASNDDTTQVYFASEDGIYYYNVKENKAEKYGTMDDSIISIAKANSDDLIYILTDDQVLYKVTEEGTKKVKVPEVVYAEQIVLDYEDNLYYYTSDNGVYVYGPDGVKEIEDLPDESSDVDILKPPFIVERGIPVVIDGKTYIAHPNGTSHIGEFELEVHPTAYSMEATLIQYYAYNKNIYEYSILALLFSDLMTDLKEYLEENSESIADIASRSKRNLR